MQPIVIGLAILQGEKDVTSGNLLPSIVVIRNSLNKLKNLDENSCHPPLTISLPLVDALLEGLEKRFGVFFKQEHFQLATALHPKFKLNWLGTNDKDERLKKQIIKKIEMHLKNLESSDSCKASTPEEPTDFYSELNKDVSSFRQHNSELTRYLEAKPTSSMSILNSYPNIKTLFKKFNAGIASSAAVERLFSLGGRVLTPTRTLLSDDNFEFIVFLKSNLSVLSL